MPRRTKTGSALSGAKTQRGERPPLRDVNAAKRAQDALQAVIAGHTFEQAAEIAGYASRGSCWSAVQRELQRSITPNVEEWRRLETKRLLDLYEKAYAIVEVLPEPELADELGLGDGTEEDELSARRRSKRGRGRQRPRTQREINLWAIDRCLAIEEQLRRLLGLDAKGDALNLAAQVLIRRYDADVEAV